jgi:hypothetical protein
LKLVSVLVVMRRLNASLAILAAAQQSGCDLVLSEDMTDGQTYGNVTVRNPFAVIRSV